MKIGFIGLGIMGSRMAANLLKKGHALTIHNRTREKAQPLLDQGATWAGSPADMAKQVNIIFTMLSKNPTRSPRWRLWESTLSCTNCPQIRCGSTAAP
jgi:3-hydroxyisobutyrate dehydrogenase-like beta-hydroxyacid dehydrogenase